MGKSCDFRMLVKLQRMSIFLHGMRDFLKSRVFKTVVLEGFILSFCENLLKSARFERFIFNFCERLVENARFGSVDCTNMSYTLH